ncbi:MAG: hypothetical protein R6U43_02925 [Candidatus Krumholzibacteriales bacterium]
MKNRNNNISCLSNRGIGDLAVQILTREGTGGDSDKGSMDEIPESLFYVRGKDKSIEHIKVCRKCRDRIIREVEYLQEYERELRRTDQCDRVREHLDVEWGKSRDIRILRFDSPEARREPELSLAASTSGAEKKAMRFSTPGGDLIIRETRDEDTGRRSLMLIGERKFAENSEVIIRGKRYFSDAEGYLRFEEDMPDLGSGDVIVVKRGRTDPADNLERH